MRDRRSSVRTTPIVLEVACRMAMGVALGLGFSFVLIADTSTLAALIAHGSEPRPTAIIVVSCLTLAFGAGAT
jgi:hypothetical protein